MSAVATRVQAAIGEQGIGVLGIKKCGEADTELILTQVTDCHKVSSVTVAISTLVSSIAMA